MKRTLALLSVLCITLSLGACGGNGAEDATVSESLTGITAETVTEEKSFEDTTVRTDIIDDTTTVTTAEKKTENTTTAKQESDAVIGDNLQKYVIDIIKTGRYTMTVKSASGGMSADYVAVFLNNNSMQKINIMNVMTLQFINYNDVCYMVSPKSKRYAEVTVEEFEKQKETISNYAMSFESSKLIKTEEVTRKGKAYTVETYEEDDGRVTKYYFTNGALAIVANVTSGGETESEYTITRGADESVFQIPASYQKVASAAAVLGLE